MNDQDVEEIIEKRSAHKRRVFVTWMLIIMGLLVAVSYCCEHYPIRFI